MQQTAKYQVERRVLVVTLMLMCLALVTVSVRPVRVLLVQPFMEDTYYALSVARNLASGHGLTIDGTQWTNGFQPLFTFVESVAFVLPTETSTSLRVILLIQAAMLLAAAGLLGIIVRNFLGSQTPAGKAGLVVAPILFLGSLFTINTGLNGLETGPLMLGYAGTCWAFQRYGASTPRRAVALGALFGLLILTRIDAAVVVIALLIAVWRAFGVTRALISAVLAVGVSAPWFLYNVLVFGSLMPSSGTAQTEIALNAERVTQMLEALSVVLMPWLPLSTFDKEWSIVLRLGLAAVVACVLWRTGAFRALNGTSLRIAQFAGAFLAGYVVLACYYATTSFAIWFYGRYLAPLTLLSAGCLALLISRSFNRLLAIMTGAIGLLGVAACLGLWTTTVYPGNPMYTDQLALVEATVPRGQLVAAKQTGTLGFFRERIINLDGKVNPQAIEFRDNLPGLLERSRVNWLCDYPTFIQQVLGETSTSWTVVANRGDFACARRSVPLQ